MTKQKYSRKVRVLGYVRVSTAEQASDGHGLDAQSAAITERAVARDWSLVGIRRDPGVSGATPADDRPALSEALSDLDAGHAEVLVVAKLDRLSRSVGDLVLLLDRAKRNGWAIVIVNGMGGLDMTTTEGKVMVTLLGAFAELERDLISRRTREGLAAARAKGVRLGRPPALPEEVVARIIAERNDGATWQAIADMLNTEGVPTAQGGIWRPGTISYIYKSRMSGPPARGVRRAEHEEFLRDAGVYS